MSEQANNPELQQLRDEQELRESLKRPADYRERLASWARWRDGMRMLHAIKAEIAAKQPEIHQTYGNV
jgi:hypothetical protein